MRKTVKYIAFISTQWLFSQAIAQDKMMSWHSEINYHYGYIIAHRNDVAVLVKDYTRITEFNISRQFNGKEEWQEKYNYPYLGAGLMIFDFGNDEQLGKGISLMAFYTFPLVRSENFEFSFKLGFGPGYVEKVFDIEDNYKNFAVSTHFNGFAHGNFTGRFTVKDHLTLSAGLSINHFSNASAKKPNLGINIPALNAGIGYRFKETDRVVREENYSFVFNKKWNHDVILAAGRKRNSIEGDLFKTFSLSYSLTKHVSFKSKFGAGTDLFYNTAHEGEESGDGTEITTAADILQAGLHFSYALQVDDLSVFINQGIYLYSPYKEDGSLYNRFGIRYLLFEHLILNLSMKTHFAVADHVEMGLGYRF